MARYFEGELHELKQQLLKMAGKAERMIHLSMEAFSQRDMALAKEVPDLEFEVNRLQLDIDDRCFKLLALRQPMAHDLRFIIAAMKIIYDLERIADQAVNILQHTEKLLQFPELKPEIDLPHMADIAMTMVHDSLDSYVEEDATKAREILIRDDEVDAMKEQISRALQTYMISDPHKVQAALQLFLIARNVERIADHATNIAEDVVYMVEAKDVRHHAEDSKQ